MDEFAMTQDGLDDMGEVVHTCSGCGEPLADIDVSYCDKCDDGRN